MKPMIARAFSSVAWLLVFGFLLATVACGKDTGMQGMKTIEGRVWYRERMALPPDAKIQIYLEDVARMDVPSEVVATTSFVPEGSSPWTFSLPYDPQRLQEKGRYVLRARIEAGGQLLFISTKQIPAFDSDTGIPIEILVSRVGAMPSGGGASAPTSDVSLTDICWKLTEIEGQPAVLGVGGRELHMVLTSDGTQVRGFSGCNRFTGSYERKEGQLHFRPLASTRMACREGMELEQKFLELLTRTTQFTISGDILALYSGDDRLILRFQAVALP